MLPNTNFFMSNLNTGKYAANDTLRHGGFYISDRNAHYRYVNDAGNEEWVVPVQTYLADKKVYRGQFVMAGNTLNEDVEKHEDGFVTPYDPDNFVDESTYKSLEKTAVLGVALNPTSDERQEYQNLVHVQNNGVFIFDEAYVTKNNSTDGVRNKPGEVITAEMTGSINELWPETLVEIATQENIGKKIYLVSKVRWHNDNGEVVETKPESQTYDDLVEYRYTLDPERVTDSLSHAFLCIGRLVRVCGESGSRQIWIDLDIHYEEPARNIVVQDVVLGEDIVVGKDPICISVVSTPAQKPTFRLTPPSKALMNANAVFDETVVEIIGSFDERRYYKNLHYYKDSNGYKNCAFLAIVTRFKATIFRCHEFWRWDDGFEILDSDGYIDQAFIDHLISKEDVEFLNNLNAYKKYLGTWNESSLIDGTTTEKSFEITIKDKLDSGDESFWTSVFYKSSKCQDLVKSVENATTEKRNLLNTIITPLESNNDPDMQIYYSKPLNDLDLFCLKVANGFEEQDNVGLLSDYRIKMRQDVTGLYFPLVSSEYTNDRNLVLKKGTKIPIVTYGRIGFEYNVPEDTEYTNTITELAEQPNILKNKEDVFYSGINGSLLSSISNLFMPFAYRVMKRISDKEVLVKIDREACNDMVSCVGTLAPATYTNGQVCCFENYLLCDGETPHLIANYPSLYFNLVKRYGYEALEYKEEDKEIVRVTEGKDIIFEVPDTSMPFERVKVSFVEEQPSKIILTKNGEDQELLIVSFERDNDTFTFVAAEDDKSDPIATFIVKADGNTLYLSVDSDDADLSLLATSLQEDEDWIYIKEGSISKEKFVIPYIEYNNTTMAQILARPINAINEVEKAYFKRFLLETDANGSLIDQYRLDVTDLVYKGILHHPIGDNSIFDLQLECYFLDNTETEDGVRTEFRKVDCSGLYYNNTLTGFRYWCDVIGNRYYLNFSGRPLAMREDSPPEVIKSGKIIVFAYQKKYAGIEYYDLSERLPIFTDLEYTDVANFIINAFYDTYEERNHHSPSMHTLKMVARWLKADYERLDAEQKAYIDKQDEDFFEKAKQYSNEQDHSLIDTVAGRGSDYCAIEDPDYVKLDEEGNQVLDENGNWIPEYKPIVNAKTVMDISPEHPQTEIPSRLLTTTRTTTDEDTKIQTNVVEATDGFQILDSILHLYKLQKIDDTGSPYNTFRYIENYLMDASVAIDPSSMDIWTSKKSFNHATTYLTTQVLNNPNEYPEDLTAYITEFDLFVANEGADDILRESEKVGKLMPFVINLNNGTLKGDWVDALMANIESRLTRDEFLSFLSSNPHSNTKDVYFTVKDGKVVINDGYTYVEWQSKQDDSIRDLKDSDDTLARTITDLSNRLKATNKILVGDGEIPNDIAVAEGGVLALAKAASNEVGHISTKVDDSNKKLNALLKFVTGSDNAPSDSIGYGYSVDNIIEGSDQKSLKDAVVDLITSYKTLTSQIRELETKVTKLEGS